ncbi:MAG: type II toxin-antitoxin system RelE/ParE family toxin [Acidobacteriota bacterium]
MKEPLAVRITRRAARQIGEAATWWEENRPAAPGAVRNELEQTLALLARQPRIGARARNVRTEGVRRVHLSRIRYYLFYRVKGSTVELLALWHSIRGSGPNV